MFSYFPGCVCSNFCASADNMEEKKAGGRVKIRVWGREKMAGNLITPKFLVVPPRKTTFHGKLFPPFLPSKALWSTHASQQPLTQGPQAAVVWSEWEQQKQLRLCSSLSLLFFHCLMREKVVLKAMYNSWARGEHTIRKVSFLLRYNLKTLQISLPNFVTYSAIL